MVTFYAKVQFPSATGESIAKAIRDFCRSEMRLAIRDFMSAMLSRIPIRTGFLSGSFIKVAAKYGLAHNPVGSHAKPEYFRRGSIKVLKNESSGQQFVTDPENTFEEQGDKFFFKVNSFIDYWGINDFFPKIPGAPWLGIDAGRGAFLDHLNTIPARFPDIRTLFGTAIVTLTRDGNVTLKHISSIAVEK